MLRQIKSAAIFGIDAVVVTVEVDVGRGMPSLGIVGLPGNAVREARDRLHSALRNSGFSIPAKRVLINLAPANIRKEGTQFDVAMAVGILAASSQLKGDFSCELFIGEVSLSGRIKPVSGVLPMMLMAKKKKIKKVFLPADNCPEAATVSGVEIIGVKTLAELADHLAGRNPVPAYVGSKIELGYDAYPDFSEVRNQKFAKRALEIAAAGGHNVLMIGPPGSGKTMLALRLPGILPPMSEKEAIETTCVYSASGLLPRETGLMKTRPFRNPHHTISDIALVGGGANAKPGEISLAHNGILFLDEFTEFNRNVIEVLRAPLEDGKISVARVRGSHTFPASFMLVAAMNPCPCGYLGHPTRECVCTPYQISKYRSKISGPILDRIDIQIEVPALRFGEIYSNGEEESSAQIRQRVVAARQIALSRLEGRGIYTNARLRVKDIKKFCKVSSSALKLLERAVDRFSISKRAVDKILKVSRTIADIESSENIKDEHVAEALQYRLESM
ncbi:MAG: YifB family Mg chelatase-like AAA ATPase [Elusimicrobia bacterium]|nr:YifB family Mg chelatase-like AAA ATPase [Elusimicrobiota bacterium]